ncbi:MAG: TIGR02996 domain-containing protein [Myxococcota bacterium]
MPSTEELFQAVYDAPADDGPRLVLADFLLEEGDPRGEFILLQFDTSARARKRAGKLLERHRPTFLGPLREVVVVGTDVWERGFPVAFTARLDGSLAACPAWATVKRLGVAWTSLRPTELASRWMSSLQEVTVAQPTAEPPWFQPAPQSWYRTRLLVEDVLKSVGREALLKPRAVPGR